MMNHLSDRQHKILQFIQTQASVSNSDIRLFFDKAGESVSRITIIRDLEKLVQAKEIRKEGAGRNVRYWAKKSSLLLRYIDPGSYFNVDVDNRDSLSTFNFEIFACFSSPIFTEVENQKLQSLTQRYQKNRAEMSADVIQKETERLTIELSWKSSQIEGNTYSLLDTEALIKEQREAPGHAKEEALMILNHKEAIDYILSHPQDYQKMSLKKIEDIHRLLIQKLPGVHHGIRSSLVRIIGTNYRPLDNIHQLKESLERTVLVINSCENVFQKALSGISLISYIQPFVDGNKRTARLIGNALLHSNHACPLSYRSVDSVEYKKAMLLFYEKNSLNYLKELFMSQYEFSVRNYFSI